MFSVWSDIANVGVRFVIYVLSLIPGEILYHIASKSNCIMWCDASSYKCVYVDVCWCRWCMYFDLYVMCMWCVWCDVMSMRTVYDVYMMYNVSHWRCVALYCIVICIPVLHIALYVSCLTTTSYVWISKVILVLLNGFLLLPLLIRTLVIVTNVEMLKDKRTIKKTLMFQVTIYDQQSATNNQYTTNNNTYSAQQTH